MCLKGAVGRYRRSLPLRHNLNIRVDMKICTRCGIVKPNSSFFEREDRVGLYSWCKVCCKKEGRRKYTWNSEMQEATGYIR